MTQTEQKTVLEDFRKGEFNTLVATCIAEEGLDIPEVQLIVCFDGAASPLRDTQRMGRTGRHAEGRVVYLLNEGREKRKFNKNNTESGYLKTLLRRSRFQFEMCQYRPKLFPQDFNPEMVMLRMETTHPKVSPNPVTSRLRAQTCLQDLQASGKKRQGKAVKSAGTKQMRLDAFAVASNEKSANKAETGHTIHEIDDLIEIGEMSIKRKRMATPPPDDDLIDLTDTEEDMLQHLETSHPAAVKDVPKIETKEPSSKTCGSHVPTGTLTSGSCIDGAAPSNNTSGNNTDGEQPLPIFWSRHIRDSEEPTVTSSRSRSDQKTETTAATTSSVSTGRISERPDISIITNDVFLAEGSIFKRKKPDPKPPNVDCTSNKSISASNPGDKASSLLASVGTELSTSPGMMIIPVKASNRGTTSLSSNDLTAVLVICYDTTASRAATPQRRQINRPSIDGERRSGQVSAFLDLDASDTERGTSSSDSKDEELDLEKLDPFIDNTDFIPESDSLMVMYRQAISNRESTPMQPNARTVNALSPGIHSGSTPGATPFSKQSSYESSFVTSGSETPASVSTAPSLWVPSQRPLCGICNKRASGISCNECQRTFHLTCITLKTSLTGAWKCDACKSA